MKWNALFAGIALIAIACLMYTCQQSKEQSNLKEAAQANNDRYLKQIAHQDSEIARRDTFLTNQTIKMTQDSVRHSNVQRSLISQINRLKGKLGSVLSLGEYTLEPVDTKRFTVVYHPIDSLYPVFGVDGDTGEMFGTAIWDRDSVIHDQDSLITDLTNERDSLRLGFNPIIDSLKANIESEHQKFLYTLHDRDSLLNRPEKPNSPISFGASIGPGVVFTPSGQVHGGMSGNIGLNIKIPLKLRNPFKRKR